MPQKPEQSWLAASERLRANPAQATKITSTPPKSVWDRILQALTGVTNPATESADDPSLGPADLAMAAIPFIPKGLAISRTFNPLHTLEDIERIAGGAAGTTRLYHGTTERRGLNILNEGFKPLPSGEVAAKQTADLYDIPWTEWQARVEPQGVGAGYGLQPS